MLPEQKKVAQAIVNVFETGIARGDYSNITLIAGDTGHLTYGRSQTTLSSGNLFLLVQQYCAAPDAQFAARLQPYLPRLKACDIALDGDATLLRLLRAAGNTDPVMRTVQDSFFDRVYWQPANDAAFATGIATPLGVAVAYDSTIHGSWERMRDATIAKVGKVAAAGEERWIAVYVATRRAWLAGNANAALHPTVYRMDTFQHLITIGNWNLSLPLIAHGTAITAADIAA